MKKLIPLILSLLLLPQICNATHYYYQDPNTKVNYHYQNDGDAGVCSTQSITIISANPGSPDAEGDIEILSGFTDERGYHKVTSIGACAFHGCNLTSVKIPNTITSIGEGAFLECSNLKSVNIPNSVNKIKSGTFWGCSSLVSVVIPNSIEVIECGFFGFGPLGYYGAFAGCTSLKSINIPSSVKSIGPNAFRGCRSLTSITIPNSVTRIEEGTFYGCKSLTSVTIPNSVTYIGGSRRDYEYGAFENCISLRSVSIPNSVTIIDDRAFAEDSALVSVNIPNSVISIGDYAFQNCVSLETISIPASVTSIGSEPFVGCNSLSTVDFNCSEVKGGLFGSTSSSRPNNSVKEIMFGENVKSIKKYAFSYFKALTTINIPKSVTTIDEDVFRGCTSLVNVNRTLLHDGLNYYYDNVLPESIKRINESAFDRCSSLKTINLPNNLDTLENSSFNGCESLEKVTFHNKLRYIGNYAFRNCKSLKELVLPNSVEEIGNGAFYNCVGLEDIRVSREAPVVGTKDIFNVDTNLRDEDGDLYGEDYIYNTTSLHVEHNHEDYEETSPWMYFKKIFHPGTVWHEFNINISVSGSGKVTYEEQEIRNGTSSFTIKTPSSYSTTLLLEPDDGCKLLSVTVNGENRLEVDNNAMRQLKLENINSETNVEVKFTNADEPQKLNDGDIFTATTVEGVRMTFRVLSAKEKTCQVGNSAVAIDGTTAGKVTIPSDAMGYKVKQIGFQAFYNCRSITDIVIPEGVEAIANASFGMCVGLAAVTIPNSVKSIQTQAFGNCNGLKTLTIGGGVTSIANYAVYNCTALTDVVSYITKPFAIEAGVFNYYSDADRGQVFTNATLYVPRGTKAMYQATEGWKEFKTIIETDFNEQPKGDLNLDSQVNGTDVVALVNVIMQGGSNSAADVNGDGKVNGTDIVALVNIVMQTSLSREMAVAGSRGGEEAEDCNATAAIGAALTPTGTDGSQELAISLTNPAMDVTMVQMDVTLPEGVTLDDNAATMGGRTTGRSHQLYASHLDERTVRLLLVSGHNALIAGTEGDIVRLPLTVGDGFRGGDIVVDHALCTSPDQTEAWPQAVVLHLAEDGTMGIGSVGMAAGESVSVHSLTGQRLAAPRKGVNIVNGKKIIVK